MIKGLRVGHCTRESEGTGVSVFLFDVPATGACWLPGSAPATHDILVLEPESSVPELHGLVFTGGSAYGLNAAMGAMTYLTERGLGHPTLHGVVPIVPTAAIYDLDYKTSVPPLAEDAYAACENAYLDNQESGQIGAATGARIGKVVPNASFMTGGVGVGKIVLESGIEVCAYVVVNCIGDVYDEKNTIIAGAKASTGHFANCNHYLLAGMEETDLFAQANTTLAAVFTNVKFSKAELKRIAKMATAGMARAISPIFTRYDGDIVFCVSLGNKTATELTVGTMAQEAIRLAIMDAVKNSTLVI